MPFHAVNMAWKGWQMGTCEKDKSSMNATVFLARLEKREAAQSGANLPDVRKAIARKIGEAPGTIENIRRGRIKRMVEGTTDKIKAALIRSIEAEIAHLSHEVEMLRRTGAPLDGDEILEAETLLSRARALLNK